MKDGLFSRIDLLLPEVGFPIRFHECRKKYTEDKGHKGSFDTTLTGIGVRLSDTAPSRFCRERNRSGSAEGSSRRRAA